LKPFRKWKKFVARTRYEMVARRVATAPLFANHCYVASVLNFARMQRALLALFTATSSRSARRSSPRRSSRSTARRTVSGRRRAT
jgi:hypothetical protein